MAEARKHVGERGKSDPIDALAVARAALVRGLNRLPTARFAGIDLDIRLLRQHRQRLVKQRTALINDLRWHLYDLWPEYKIPARQLREPLMQTKTGRGYKQQTRPLGSESHATNCAACES